MKLSDKINQVIHPFFAWRLRQRYYREMRTWERVHPESFGDIPEELKSQYVHLWSKLIHNPYDGWLRLLTKLSGKMDYRFMPADVYYSVIERCFNDCNYADSGIEDKNKSYFYISSKFTPHAILRYVRGVFFDEDFRPISTALANDLLKSYKDDVVGKQAAESSGGASVHCFCCQPDGRKTYRDIVLTADWIAKHAETYIVQERVKQEPVISSFNPSSVNTCRLVTFRRPWSGRVSVIANMLRMGAGSEIVDNMSSGGVCTDINEQGFLAATGVTPDFARVNEHPVSHKRFAGVQIPGYADMCKVACEVASRIPEFNLLGFDMMMRTDGTPCVIEVNATSIASVMVQMGKPFFGDETERVIDWCLENRKFDFFRHIRTFY